MLELRKLSKIKKTNEQSLVKLQQNNSSAESIV